MTEILKDKRGNRVGEVRSESGRLVLVDSHGTRLGEYDPKTNMTKDAHGNRVGQGNLLTSLLK